MLTGYKDIDSYILLKLHYRDIFSLSKTCKYFNKLCKSKIVWKNKLIKDFPLRSKYLWYPEYITLYNENPKKLYQILNLPSKIIEIYHTCFSQLFTCENEEEELKIVNEEIWKKKKLLPFLRGDVIHLSWYPAYRNYGKYIWTGEKLIKLYYEYDDYGVVPFDFTFPEFPLDHFHMSIVHNTYIAISPDIVSQAIRNFNESKQESMITDRYYEYILKNIGSHISKEDFSRHIINKNFIYENGRGYILSGTFSVNKIV